MFFGKEGGSILNGTINIRVLKRSLKSDYVRFWYRNMEESGFETKIIQTSGFDTPRNLLRVSVFSLILLHYNM